jgi:hypothetical protein
LLDDQVPAQVDARACCLRAVQFTSTCPVAR